MKKTTFASKNRRLFKNTVWPRLRAVLMSATCLIALFMALDIAFTAASLDR